MNFERLWTAIAHYAQIAAANPTTPCVMIAAAIIGYLVLWLCNIRALESVHANVAASRKSMDALQRLAESVDEMHNTLQTKSLAAESVALVNQIPSLRAQVLVLHRRGDPADGIATALKRPKNEIEMVLKLNRLLRVER